MILQAKLDELWQHIEIDCTDMCHTEEYACTDLIALTWFQVAFGMGSPLCQGALNESS